MSESPTTTTTTATTPRDSTDGRQQPTPRVSATAGPADRSSSARRTTTSFTMHAASLPDSSTERRNSAVMTPKQQPLTSKLLEALPETSLVWPTPRRGASSVGRPSGRSPSQSGARGDTSTTSRTTSGTSSRCRSAHMVTPHRVPAAVPTPPPLLDVERGPSSGAHAGPPRPRCGSHAHRDPLRGSSSGGSRHLSPGATHPLNLDLVPLTGLEQDWGFRAHPSEAPSAVYAAEAEAMAPDALMAAVRGLREDVRVLNTAVERDHAQLVNLQDGMSKLYADVERQQEGIANTLLRRIHHVKRAKERLQIELYQIDREKTDRRAKLAETKRSVGRVKSHMKREEGAILQRLEQKLRYQQQQRSQLDALLEEHAASLQTLETLVNDVQSMDIPATAPEAAMAPSAAGMTPQRRSSTLSNTSASATRSPHTRPAAAPGSGIPSAARWESDIVPPSPSHSLSKLDSSSTVPTSRPPPSPLPAASSAQLTPSSTTGAPCGGGGAGSLSAALSAMPSRHERSSSQLSVASSSVAATEQTAYDPRDMVAYLEQEIAAVTALRQDVVSRAKAYEEKCTELRHRLSHAARVKGESRRRLSQVEQALEDTSTKATTLAVAQQLASEMDSERMLNEALAGGRTPQRLSSASASATTSPCHTFVRSPNAAATLLVQNVIAPPALSMSSTDLRDISSSSTAHDVVAPQAPVQRISQLSVQSTARMEPPRPLPESAGTTPLRSPQCIGPDAEVPPPLNLNA